MMYEKGIGTSVILLVVIIILGLILALGNIAPSIITTTTTIQISCSNNFDCPEKMKCQNSICIDVGCVTEGGALPGPISPEYVKHMASECCEGLKAIMNSVYFDENCNPTGFAGTGGICSKCGNGICESWETKCTCSEDCK